MFLSVPKWHIQERQQQLKPTHTMHNHCKIIGALAAASAIVAGNATAGETPSSTTTTAPPAAIEYDLHVGYSSEYLWRGQDLGARLVESGLDVKGTWNGIGLSGGLWYGDFQGPTGYSPSSKLDSANASELDMYAEVSKDFGFLTTAVGYIYYNYPQGSANRYLLAAHDNQEVYFAIGHDFGFLKATYTYFWAVAGADNNGYSELALSRSFVLDKCFTLDLATNLGYQFEVGQCNAWTTRATLDWAFTEHAKFSPFVALSIALSDNSNSTYTAGSKNQLVGGTALTVTF